MSNINQNNFKEKLKEWMSIQNKIDEYNKFIKLLKEEKDKKESNILKYMKDKNLDSRTIKFNNNKFNVGNDNSYTTLSYKYIEETLKKKFSDTSVKDIITFLKKEREKKTTQILKRTIIKQK